jgi:acyl carrier protein
LILALEAEFNITLSPDEAAEMLSVGLIRKVLRDKRVTSI